MDRNQFRLPTTPDLRPNVNQQKVENIAIKKELPPVTTAPIDDPRYAGYAGPMSDGRLITDYRSHCEYNYSPSKYGESVRLWLQHNADAVMQVTRKRQADRVGAQYLKARTVPPAQVIQGCDEFQCGMDVNFDRAAIGIARREGCPALFGTFSDPYLPAPSPSGVALTSVYEGGRNTPRGRDFQPLAGRSFATDGVSG